MKLWTTKITVSKYPCLTFTATMQCLDAKTSSVPSIAPHSTFNLIGPCNTHPNRQSHKATKIHTLTAAPLTYELFFRNSSKRGKLSAFSLHLFKSALPLIPLGRPDTGLKLLQATDLQVSFVVARRFWRILEDSGRDNSEKIRQVLRHFHWQAIDVLIVLQPITVFRWQTWPG